MAQVNRRGFLKFATAGAAGFLFGCRDDGAVDSVAPDAGVPDASGDVPGEPLVSYTVLTWVSIRSDNRVTIAMHKAEMGQGISTTLPLLIAEEMDLAADQIDKERDRRPQNLFLDRHLRYPEGRQ